MRIKTQLEKYDSEKNKIYEATGVLLAMETGIVTNPKTKNQNQVLETEAVANSRTKNKISHQPKSNRKARIDQI